MRCKIKIVLIVFLIFKIGFSQSVAGEDLTFKNNEISPAVYFNFRFGHYNFQGPYFNLTIIPKDTYNNNRTNFSMSGVFSISPFLLMYPILHGNDSTDTTKRYIFLSFGIITSFFNSQHHLRFLDHYNPLFKAKSDLSLFANIRTDLFMLKGKNWIRYDLGIGMEYLVFTHKYIGNDLLEGVSFHIGREKYFDFVSGDIFKEDYRWFFGIKLLSK